MPTKITIGRISRKRHETSLTRSARNTSTITAIFGEIQWRLSLSQHLSTSQKRYDLHWCFIHYTYIFGTNHFFEITKNDDIYKKASSSLPLWCNETGWAFFNLNICIPTVIIILIRWHTFGGIFSSSSSNDIRKLRFVRKKNVLCAIVSRKAKRASPKKRRRLAGSLCSSIKIRKSLRFTVSVSVCVSMYHTHAHIYRFLWKQRVEGSILLL